MIHRREGEAEGEAGLPGFSNSEYWFGRLGNHPLFPAVAAAAAALPSWPLKQTRGGWNPRRFVGLCEDAASSMASSERGGEELGEFCLQVQRDEWSMLFDYCAEIAAA